MFSGKVIARVLIPAAAVVTESSKDKHEKLCRPSELPIYSPECTTITKSSESNEPGLIENYFATARRTIVSVTNQFNAFQRVAEENVQAGIDQADWLIKYLGEEDNFAPKVGAIAVGGLAGYILGLRGGKFKRLLYASVGALGMASICYPKQAAEYSHIAAEEGKKYATIGYNFIYGVKKGDPPLELPTLPTVSIPSSVSEAWDAVKNLGKSQSSVAEKEEKVKVDSCGKTEAVTTEVTISDPATVVSSLHEQCHCPVGECLHDNPNPTLPGL